MKRGELDDLVAFAMIARMRSFTRAAAELGLSPSALSHTVRELELRLGVRLLARTTRSVAPTAAGERLLGSLGPALNELKASLESFRDWSGDISGSIRITASPFSAQTVLAPALPKFLLEHPNVSVEVNVDNRLVDLVRDGFDAGIRWGKNVEQDMIAVRVGPPVRMIVAGAPGYFERHRPPQDLADLEAHNCINYRLNSSGGIFPWALTRDDKEMRSRVAGQLVLDEPDLATALVVAGAGLGLILEPKAAPHLAAGRLVHVLREWSVPFAGLHLYYPSRHVPPALRALIDALKWKSNGASSADPDRPEASSHPPEGAVV